MRERLVRDKTPEIAEKTAGVKPVIRIAKDDEEYFEFLMKRLEEEVEGLREAPDPERAVNIGEVLDAIYEHLGMSLWTIYNLKRKKAKEKGRFKKRLIQELLDEPDMPKADP